MFNLKQKTVLITGASSGFGEAFAYRFAEAGARLLLCARRLDALTKVANHCREHYHAEVHTFTLDVRDNAAVQQSIAALPAEWSNIDILINNAGLALGLDPMQTGNIDDWETMIDTNVKGLLYMTRAILPQMVARESGHIINMGSIAGHEIYPNGAIYCATKHAVNSLTQSLRMDVLGKNIRVSTVDPGAAETEFSLTRFKGDADRAKAVYTGMRALTADDVADAVLYCATRPAHVNVSEIIIMSTDQASVMQIARKTN